jgi:hypothetical protein
MSHKTLKFDTAMCTSAETLQLYKNVCQHSKKCEQDMQNFCKKEIHTNKEFNTQTDLLQCITQCDSDKTCKKDCVKSFH